MNTEDIKNAVLFADDKAMLADLAAKAGSTTARQRVKHFNLLSYIAKQKLKEFHERPDGYNQDDDTDDCKDENSKCLKCEWPCIEYLNCKWRACNVGC